MLTPARKKELIETYRINEADTGSPEVQIAILSESDQTPPAAVL